MPRKRSKKAVLWRASIQSAVEAFKNGEFKSVWATPKAFNISETTLRARINGRVTQVEDNESRQLLSNAEETMLAKRCTDLTRTEKNNHNRNGDGNSAATSSKNQWRGGNGVGADWKGLDTTIFEPASGTESQTPLTNWCLPSQRSNAWKRHGMDSYCWRLCANQAGERLQHGRNGILNWVNTSRARRYRWDNQGTVTRKARVGDGIGVYLRRRICSCAVGDFQGWERINELGSIPGDTSEPSRKMDGQVIGMVWSGWGSVSIQTPEIMQMEITDSWF